MNCRYAGYDRDRAIAEITLLMEDKDAEILSKCTTCIACKFCLWVCPYGSPQFYHGKMYLCDLCIHRIGEERQKGRQTACEAACPARAIHVGTTDEISDLKGEEAAERAGQEK